MKKSFLILLGSLMMLIAASSFAMGNSQDQDNKQPSQPSNPAVDRAKLDYRVYLEQLKALGQQYNQITGETKRIIKEEGVPVFDEKTGQIKISHDLNFSDSSPVKETDTEMKLTLEIPGVKKDSIKVTIEDDTMLHVKGIRKVEDNEIVIDKSIQLPAKANDKNPRAKYEDGILTVIVKKAETPKKEVAVPVT